MSERASESFNTVSESYYPSLRVDVVSEARTR
jgi:hypothetical protein